jgi:RNA polymerase sigma factor (sigma-70 family)
MSEHDDAMPPPEADLADGDPVDALVDGLAELPDDGATDAEELAGFLADGGTLADDAAEEGPIPTDGLPPLLRAMAAHPLLSADEERRLGEAIAAGRRAEERLRAAADLPAAERRQLSEAVARGREARRQLARQNVRLALSVARRYARPGYPLEDAVQDGVLGLLRAADRYDPNLGYRFSTYATWWIRQAIRRGLIEQGRSLRLPEHVVGTLARLGREDARLHAALGRPPTTAELAAAAELSPERLQELLAAQRAPASLDAPVDEGERALGDVVPDERAAVAERAEAQLLRAEIERLLDTLPDREQEVMRLRYGLGDTEPLTLAEIGERLGISRERVRQLEAQALRKLRARAGPLRDVQP